MGAPAHLAADQPGVLQRLDVLRGGGERHGEGLGELADGALAVGEFAQHPPARGVAEGVEDGSSWGVCSSTIWLNIAARFWIVNRLVE